MLHSECEACCSVRVKRDLMFSVSGHVRANGLMDNQEAPPCSPGKAPDGCRGSPVHMAQRAILPRGMLGVRGCVDAWCWCVEVLCVGALVRVFRSGGGLWVVDGRAHFTVYQAQETAGDAVNDEVPAGIGSFATCVVQQYGLTPDSQRHGG